MLIETCWLLMLIHNIIRKAYVSIFHSLSSYKNLIIISLLEIIEKYIFNFWDKKQFIHVLACIVLVLLSWSFLPFGIRLLGNSPDSFYFPCAFRHYLASFVLFFVSSSLLFWFFVFCQFLLHQDLFPSLSDVQTIVAASGVLFNSIVFRLFNSCFCL